MADLKTNYKDDVLDTSKNEKRKFRMIQNDDGTVSFDDATEYTQQGDAFGAADINATNAKINEQSQSLTNKIPDYAHFDTLGTPTTGYATYNISKDGFFQLRGATLTTSASIFYRIRINNVIIEEGFTVNMRYGYYTSPLFPVLKGDVVKVEVDTSVAGVNYEAKLYHTR